MIPFRRQRRRPVYQIRRAYFQTVERPFYALWKSRHTKGTPLNRLCNFLEWHFGTANAIELILLATVRLIIAAGVFATIRLTVEAIHAAFGE